MDLEKMDDIADQFRCSCCKNYLTYQPVMLLPDGTAACGRCNPQSAVKNPGGPIVKVLALEKALQKISFPCRYRFAGCKDRVLVGHFSHNQDKCVHRALACPILECTWSGSTSFIPAHLAESHAAMVKTKLEFKLQLSENAMNMFMAIGEGIPFLVKYTYRAASAKLLFEIRSLTHAREYYQIVMSNVDVDNCSVSLRRKTCYAYAFQDFEVVTLTLDKYLPVLEEPTCVVINMKIIPGADNAFRLLSMSPSRLLP